MKNICNILSIFIIIFLFLPFIFGFTYQTETQLYTGEIEHLCFNTLIAFPSKALTQDNHNYSDLDNNKITPIEFKNILIELYLNNFVLIDIHELYDVTTDSLLTLKPLYLPKNKKPIILSFDNVTYRSNYQNSGGIDKIIIDRNNTLATYSTKQSIQDRINHDNEFIPILENFVSNHPNFSYNGAKGIICFTGEHGILGYNTNPKKASSKQDIKRASQIINKLKSSGWRFACNNYKYVREDSISDIEFAKEISMWTTEIQPIIDQTNIYAYPYGFHSENETVKQTLLRDNGFNIFFENSLENRLEIDNNALFMNRKFVCGNSLRNHSNIFENLFDCRKVYDHTNRISTYPIKKA